MCLRSKKRICIFLVIVHYYHMVYLENWSVKHYPFNVCSKCSLHSLVKTKAKSKIREEISENPRHSWGFSPAREFSQTWSRFSVQVMKALFYFFYKIMVFWLYWYTKGVSIVSFLSWNWLTSFSCFIAPYWNSLVDFSKLSYYPNYFINYVTICSTF